MNEVIGYVVKFADNTYYTIRRVDSTKHTKTLRQAKVFKSVNSALKHGVDFIFDKNNKNRKVVKVIIKEIEEEIKNEK